MRMRDYLIGDWALAVEPIDTRTRVMVGHWRNDENLRVAEMFVDRYRWEHYPRNRHAVLAQLRKRIEATP